MNRAAALAALGGPQPCRQRQNRRAQQREDHETARNIVEGYQVEKRHTGLRRRPSRTACQPKGAGL